MRKQQTKQINWYQALGRRLQAEPWHRRLFFLLVFLIPLGGRLRFVGRYSYVHGVLIDYLTVELFITDLIIWALLFMWIIRLLAERRLPKASWRLAGAGLALLVMLLAGWAGVEKALNPTIVIYRLVRQLQWLLLVFHLGCQHFKKQDWYLLGWVVWAGGVLQSLLGWFQFVFQRSFSSGFLALLIGEQPISGWERGVSFIWVYGKKLIRPYGTFEHPNLLAGYLLGALMAGLGLFVLEKGKHKAWLGGGLILILATIGISLTRLVWLLIIINLLLLAVYYKLQGAKWQDLLKQIDIQWQELPSKVRVFLRKVWPFGLLLGGGLGLLGMVLRMRMFWRGTNISLIGRMMLNQHAAGMIRNFPGGVGAGNFTNHLLYYDLDGYFGDVIQPVHNIYLLIASEQGWLALLGFLIVLGLAWHSLVGSLCKRTTGICENASEKKANGMDINRDDGKPVGFPIWSGMTKKRVTFNHELVLLLCLQSFVLIGFFDHYLWTLQPGQLMLMICLGLGLSFGQTVEKTDQDKKVFPNITKGKK